MAYKADITQQTPVRSMLPGQFADTSSGLHLAIGGLADTTGDGLLAVNPVVETVWHWNAGSPSAFPQMPKGLYAPMDRQTYDVSQWPGSQTLAWFLDNHPDWLMYQGDRQTLAYEFSTLGLVQASPAPTTTTFTTSTPEYGSWAAGTVQVGTQSGTILSVATSTAITLSSALSSAPKAGQTVAQGDSHSWPVDVSNPACLAWLETNLWKPALDTGNYSLLAIDNFVLTNNGSWSGQRIGHYATAAGTMSGTAGQSQITVTTTTGLAANGFIAVGSSSGMEYKQIGAGYAGGTTVPLTSALVTTYAGGTWLGLWTAQYTGTGTDSAYRAYQIALSRAIAGWVRSSYPKIAYSPNFSYDTNFDADSKSVLATADILFTENGFTNGGNSPFKILDTTWTTTAAAYWAYLSQPGTGWIDENHTSANVASTTSAERLWCIANYLLLKNARSWMYLKGPTDLSAPNTVPEQQTVQTIGQPLGQYYADQSVYRRDFANGLVLVNPSSTTPVTVTIPPYAYKDLYGLFQPGSVTLAAGTATVLIGKYSPPNQPLVRNNTGAYGNRGVAASGFSVANASGGSLGSGSYIYGIAYVTTGQQVAVPSLLVTASITGGAATVTMPQPGSPVIGRQVSRSVLNPTGYVNIPPMWLVGDYTTDNIVTSFTDTMSDTVLQTQPPAPSMVVSPDQTWVNQLVVTKGLVIQGEVDSASSALSESAFTSLPGWLVVGHGGILVQAGCPAQLNGHLRYADTSNVPTFANAHANLHTGSPAFVSGNTGSDTRGWISFTVDTNIPANTRLFTVTDNSQHTSIPHVKPSWQWNSGHTIPASGPPGELYVQYNANGGGAAAFKSWDLYCNAIVPADANAYEFLYLVYS